MTCVSCPGNIDYVAQVKIVVFFFLLEPHTITIDTPVFSCYNVLKFEQTAHFGEKDADK